MFIELAGYLINVDAVAWIGILKEKKSIRISFKTEDWLDLDFDSEEEDGNISFEWLKKPFKDKGLIV